MSTRGVVHSLLVAAALIAGVPGIALANGGGELAPSTSTSPLALIPAGLAAVAVAYVLFRIFRGRRPKP